MAVNHCVLDSYDESPYRTVDRVAVAVLLLQPRVTLGRRARYALMGYLAFATALAAMGVHE